MPRINPVDLHVGARLRLARDREKLTQSALAAGIGVSFQQVQKYENGANRVSASTLWAMCATLKVTPNFFFEGLTHGKTHAYPVFTHDG